MTAPAQLDRPEVDEASDVDRPWVTIVWNDPVNLMSYVTLVLQELFGYTRSEATKLMLAVHQEGRAVVSTGSREQMEHDVARCHAKGLWATLQQDWRVRFKKARGGLVTADVDPVEAHVLGQCATDLLTLLADDEDADDAPRDPLEALVGLSGDVEAPDDPALARLLPDAYGGDDPEAAREFRRYTDGDLRAGKRAGAGTVLATLPSGGGRMALDRDQCDAWLGCLNDLRLVLGTRLEVTEELDPDDLPEDDPRAHALEVYSWLGWLQESLISCLTPRR